MQNFCSVEDSVTKNRKANSYWGNSFVNYIFKKDYIQNV